MGRIIVNNRSDLTDMKAMELCMSVINLGRISNDNKQYCYLTSFDIEKSNYHVVTDLRKSSDSFIVYKSSYPTKNQ
jgi:hypothetical protein